MPRHVEVYLDGVSLRDAAPKIWIKQVTEDVTAPEVTTAPFPGWDGERPIRSVRRSMRVTIAATIHEVHDLAVRSAALDAIAGWMRAGTLTVSYRPGRRLRVVPTGRPSLGKVRDYTQEVTMEFTAYAPPYWEDSAATEKVCTAGTTGSVTLNATGTTLSPLGAAIVPSATLTEFELTAGNRTVSLEGLELASGKQLVFAHTPDGFLTITADGVGVLSCRTADSADDLEVSPGANTVTWEADASCAVTLITRGRYE